MTQKEIIEYIRNWAKSHPEKQKVTNGKKFEEVFGGEAYCVCFRPRHTECIDSTGNISCASCDYGNNGEYKEPENK